MGIKKVVSIVETSVTDTNTGENKSSHKLTTSLVETEPHYVKLYLDDISTMFNLIQYEYNVLLCLCSIAEYGTGIIALNPYIKKEKIINPLGIKDQTLRNALKNLKDKKLILYVGRGTYRLNPQYIATGSWKDIKALKLSIIYDENGKEIKIEKIKETENKKDHQILEKAE
ncbi:replication/maintenance protein RepL [Paraclostridium bifermentans]|uniref:replication/maintenance protein RepL n=1 Tax=Paraclostridium bifermentans TaxID=1490 RepID=UPI00242BBC6E|nr:replication/maintenance protein RepL [Paraclostridium bifermentans]